ncbi:hypothetical protein ACXYMO_07030 [Arenibacterium sp. CAU 1754]
MPTIAPPSVTQIPSPPVAVRPGKSAQSIGHQAKQAVAAAREAGVEAPRNAQGAAASQIAQGADPASVFAARIAELPPAPTDAMPSGSDAPSDLTAGYQFNAPAITTSVLEPASAGHETLTGQ